MFTLSLLAALPLCAQVRLAPAPLPLAPLSQLPSLTLEAGPLGSMPLPSAPLALPALPTRLMGLSAAPYQEWEKAQQAATRLGDSVGYGKEPTVIGVELKQEQGKYVLVLHALGDGLSHFQKWFDGYHVEKALDADTPENRAAVEEGRRFAKWNKGRPYSHTEFSIALHYAHEGLAKRNVSAKYLELFDLAVNLAPINGGSFNSWSGD